MKTTCWAIASPDGKIISSTLAPSLKDAWQILSRVWGQSEWEGMGYRCVKGEFVTEEEK